MTIGAATTDQRYAAKALCLIANRAIEALTLTNNTSAGVISVADTAGTAAIAALVAAGVPAGGGGSGDFAVNVGDVVPVKGEFTSAPATAIKDGHDNHLALQLDPATAILLANHTAIYVNLSDSTRIICTIDQVGGVLEGHQQ